MPNSGGAGGSISAVQDDEGLGKSPRRVIGMYFEAISFSE